jgi:hypothetical protein
VNFLSLKAIALLSAAILMMLQYVMPIRHLAMDTHELLNPLEPAISLFTGGAVFPNPFFFIILFLLLLMGDAPLTGSDFSYRVIRMTRSAWCIGEVFHIMASVAMYIALIASAAILSSLGCMGDWQEWSRVSYTLAMTDAAQVYGVEVAPVMTVMRAYPPLSAFLHSVALLWLYGVFSCLVIFFCNALRPSAKPWGLGLAFIIYFFDYIRFYNLPVHAMRYSPALWARISTLDLGFDPRVPSIQYAYIAFGVGIAVLIIMLMLGARGFSLDHTSSRIQD